MSDENEYLAIIPARGGSKGVERKNVRELAGEPLIAHTVHAAGEAVNLDRTIVSTDDEEIRRVAEASGAEVPFLRPRDLATDEAPMNPVVEHAITHLGDEEGYSCDAVVLLQPTSPLRTANHIDRAVEIHERRELTTVISVYPDHSYRWRSSDEGAMQLNYTGSANRRQDKRPEYVENGAIYICDTEHFLVEGELRSGTVGLFEMRERDSIDIDTEFDFWLAEAIKRRRNGTG